MCGRPAAACGCRGERACALPRYIHPIDPNVVAVYGSLRAGLALPDQPDLSGRLVALGPCTMTGLLYDLGEYPGLVPGEGQVVGELYELGDPEVIRELDAYEGYDASRPDRSEYVRRVAPLIRPRIDAWLYYFNGRLGDREPVASGDWAAHVRGRNARRRSLGRRVY